MINIGRCFFDPNTPLNILLDVIKELPSPLPNIKYDLDKDTYSVTSDNKNFCISRKGKNNSCRKLKGQMGYVFSKVSLSDDKAYHVDEGCVGFATNEKMGTTNVQDCVALIIQDRKVKSTALAHISIFNSEEAIQGVLSYMPEGSKEVIMIGARYDDKIYNLEKILKALTRYEHDIFIDKSYVCDSAYIYDESSEFEVPCYELNTATGDIVVDPSNLQISCGSAKREFSEFSETDPTLSMYLLWT